MITDYQDSNYLNTYSNKRNKNKTYLMTIKKIKKLSEEKIRKSYHIFNNNAKIILKYNILNKNSYNKNLQNITLKKINDYIRKIMKTKNQISINKKIKYYFKFKSRISYKLKNKFKTYLKIKKNKNNINNNQNLFVKKALHSDDVESINSNNLLSDEDIQFLKKKIYKNVYW